MDSMDSIRLIFFQECEESVSDLEAGLLLMQDGARDRETVDAVFRAVHSIKGGAGAFSLDALVRFAHVFETTLEEVRSDRLEASPALLAAMLRATDVLADIVAAARDDATVDEARVASCVSELELFGATGAAGEVEDEEDDFGFTPLRAGGDEEPDFGFTPLRVGGGAPVFTEAPAQAAVWIIRFIPTTSLYAHANEPLLFLRELGRLGSVEVTLEKGGLPPLQELDPERAYIGWTIRLMTDASEDAIREVFEFVDGDCELSIKREADGTGAAEVDIFALIQRATAGAAESAPPAAPMMSAVAERPEAAIASAETPAPDPRKADDAAAEAPTSGGAAAAPTIRVDLPRIDRLIDLVGELVINQAMLSQRVSEAGLTRASAAVMALNDLEQLTREIQDSVMAIRAQPVKSVFQRMPRLVRETAALVDKQVRLVTEGEATEVDKTVIERLADPLTHMIRNAIDHGVESKEKRLAAGKPAEAVVRLSALHRSGRIVLEVADDGGGIDRQRVRQIAVDRGLIEADAPLSDEEIDNLIFMPGFSTATAVSDISGRGVGMDVVRRSIQGLGGRISISSRAGQGSTFTLSLPLTLAVLDGMVVTVAGQTLVVPLTAMIETLQPRPSNIYPLGGGRVIRIRDDYLPLIDVGVTLGYRAAPLPGQDAVALLVETEGAARTVLLVDAIQGQRQVVIKSLESNFRHVPGIAAATILGDGRVALILDVDAVVARAQSRQSAVADEVPPPAEPLPYALTG